MKTPHADIAGKATRGLFKPLPKYRYVAPSYLKPRPGEYTMKQFCLELATALEMQQSGVYERIRRNMLRGFSRRYVNMRVVFVRPELPLPEYLARVRAHESERNGFDVVAGPDLLGQRSGEVTTLEWLRQQARRLKITPAAAKERFYRGQLPCPPRRKAGFRIYVQVGTVNGGN